MPYSGQFADAATQMDDGIKLYLKQHGDKLGGKKVEIIRKDVGGINPSVAKRLAQELVTRDNVDILAGFVADAERARRRRRVRRSQEIHGGHERGHRDHHHQVALYGAHFADRAAARRKRSAAGRKSSGLKNAYTMVTDYGPGIDAEGAFQRGFKAAGGDIVGSVRMAVQNPGLHRLCAARQGSQSAGHLRHDPGRRAAGRLRQGVGRGRHRSEEDRESWGNWRSPTSMRSPAWATSPSASSRAATTTSIIKSKLNEEFVKAYNADFKRNPDFFSVGGYDGMHLIDIALQKSGGKTDGESLINAAKGASWESPRGPISIDPETRDIVQTVYIRKVEKVGGHLVNVEIAAIPNVKDPVKAAMKH